MLCHDSVTKICMAVTVTILFILTDTAIQRKVIPIRIKEHYSLIQTPVPWLGVLKLGKEGDGKVEKIIPVILISGKAGIGDARSVASLSKYDWKNIKNITYVMLLTNAKQVWYANVQNYILHPEYNKDTLTTLALLILECGQNYFKDKQLLWPFNYSTSLSTGGHVFAIGYTDYNGILEQKMYWMEYTAFKECEAFYVNEELDSKWMRPKQYHCYNVRFQREPCVFEPGMVLVNYVGKKFYFMGISVWGPGCSLPTRFIDFEPFVPWVRSIISKIKTRKPSRRLWSEDAIDLPRINRDEWMLERIRDQKGLTLRPINSTGGGQAEETVHGKCNPDNMRDGNLIYREVTNFTFPATTFQKSVAVYGLSLYNLNYPRSNYTCIQVIAGCKEKSKSQLEFTKGFEEMVPFEPYVKRVPIPHSAYKKYVYNPYIHTVNEHWDQYRYEILGAEITHLIFRFEFELSAWFEVSFYGNRSEIPTTTSSTTTTTAAPTTKAKGNKTTVKSTTRKLRTRVTVSKPTPAPDYYYDGWWFEKGPKKSATTTATTQNTTIGQNTTITTTPKATRTTNTVYWFNKWWKYPDNKEDLFNG